MSYQTELDRFESWLNTNAGNEPEFHQAAIGIAKDIIPVYQANQDYKDANILYRLAEPERVIQFKVDWVDDYGTVQTQRAWRVQFNGSIGPYKGGLRFHPSVNLSILKFLGYEQCYKNALTGLPMGGAKGGANFNPRGKSDNEIMRFCQALMSELYRHIGPYTDVPAGDINVGAREIGFLYGKYRRLTNQFGGSLTGKNLAFGGSHVRTESTGFGLVYFLNEVLKQHHSSIEGKKIAISGAGNVAIHAALKAAGLGAKVLCLSNSKGVLKTDKGLKITQIKWLKSHQYKHKNLLASCAKEFDLVFAENKSAWDVSCDVALPCATQNEVSHNHIQTLEKNGCKYLLEGANMPLTSSAEERILSSDMIYVPGKASNAGGVALSGLEMSQNAGFARYSFDELDSELQSIMQNIHASCAQEGTEKDKINYSKGANISGFRILADAMLAQGV